MELKEVLSYLCARDPRNPNNCLEYYDGDEEKPPPRVDCACDNCFYSRDKLAVEILRLKGVQ